MLVSRFSTDDLPADERVEMFVDEIGRNMISANVNAAPGGEARFRVAQRTADWGAGYALSRGEASALSITRDRRAVRDGDEDFSFHLPRGTALRVVHNDNSAAIGRGEGLLVSHARPIVSVWNETGFDCIRLPRAAMAALHRPDDLCGKPVPLTSLNGRLLQSYLRHFWRAPPGDGESHIAARHIGELLVATLSGSVHQAPSTDRARFAAMLETIARHYGRQGLAMADIARDVGVSRRLGYEIFERHQTDFSAHLRAIRLTHAAEMLASARPRKIETVAHLCGFRDVSNFTRHFRTRFGLSPSAYRAANARTN